MTTSPARPAVRQNPNLNAKHEPVVVNTVVMSKNQAFCYFCSKPDDSIQVICLSRCLVCSRCQLVPTIRKLLLDHCEIIPLSALHNGVSNAVTTASGLSGTGLSSKKSNNGKFADGYLSSTMNQIIRETSTNTILYLSNNFIQNVTAVSSSTANTTLVNSSNLIDDAISTLRPNTANSASNGNGQQLCMRGTCPICGVGVPVGMLQIILEYKEALKSQAEEELTGKSSATFELEETSALIPNFLKRYRSTYETTKEKDSPPLDQSDPFSILNVHASSTTPNSPGGNLMSSKEGGGSKKQNNSGSGAIDPMETLNVPPKQTLQTMLEFLVDCYCGQLHNMLKNGNDSMLTVMMRQAIRKKFSQKTNDYKIKSLIDYMIAPSGSENAELILFCHLVGLQPKPTIKLSAGWSHIATTIIACALCDKTAGKNNTGIDGIASSPIPTTMEFRNKISKYLTVNGNLGRCIGAKRAVKLINILFSIRQAYWVMAPVTSQCIEYQCRLPWCRESMSKLFNILLFVMLYEEPAQLNRPVTPGTAGNPSTNIPTAANSSKVSRVPSRDASHATGSTTPNHNHSRRNTGVFTAETSNCSATSRGGTGGGGETTNGGGSSRSRRCTTDSAFGKSLFNASVASNGNNTTNTKGYSRMDMLKSLDPMIEKIWNSFAHPFLKIPRPSNNVSHQYDALMINPYQGLIDYFMSLDSLAASPSAASECFYIDCDEEQFLRIAESASLNISIHELALVLIRCWEAEYASVKQALVKSIITAQRRTGIVGSYDARLANMTATERLAITRLLHFYRTEDESDKLGTITASMKPPRPIFGLGNRPYYPGIYQFRGIDWDEVEANVHRKYYPFSIPLTLLSKSRVELNTLSEQVTDLILTQQIKDIEDDLAWKARIAKEEEDNKLPDIAELYHECTPLDSEEESDEESRQFIKDFMKEGQKNTTGGSKGDPAPSLAQAKANYKKLKAARRSNNANDGTDGDLHGRKALTDNKAILELESNLPSNPVREAFQQQKDGLTPAGFLRGALSPIRPLSAAAAVAARSTNQSRPGSAYPKNATDTIYHTKDGQVSLVEIIDNDGEVLEKTHLLSRPKSGVVANSSRVLSRQGNNDIHPLDKLTSHPSGFDPQPLEVIIKELPPPEEHKLPLSISGRRTTPHHEVRIEKDRDGQGHKIYVDDEIFQNPTSTRSNTSNDNDHIGLLLKSSSSKKSLAEVEEDIYRKSLEDFKRAKVMEARSKILVRANNHASGPQGTEDSTKSTNTVNGTTSNSGTMGRNSAITIGKESSKSKKVSTPNVNLHKDGNSKHVEDGACEPANKPQQEDLEDYKRHFNSADILGAFGRATTAGSSAYHQRHRIEPYLNLAKHINHEGQLVIERENNLIIESAIQYLTLQQANITLSTLQEVCQIFCKDWQMEYLRILDLSGNSQLGSMGMKLLCHPLKKSCNLIHLNLNQMNIGDSGLKMLLKAIVQGNGEMKLLRLELQKNQLTFASDAISMLSSLKKLKALDLSGNYFTLDTSLQMKYFENGIRECKDLNLLSVAFNKIQDRGFVQLIEIISRYQLPIKALDVAGCFLTDKSCPLIQKVLKTCPALPSEVEVSSLPQLRSHHSGQADKHRYLSDPAIDETSPNNDNTTGTGWALSIEKLFLHKNLFGVAIWETILVEYQPGSSCRIQHKDPYTGITVIPCYNLRDFGIIVPSIHSFVK